MTVPWPNESWPPAELEAQNIDAAPIERLLDHLSRGVYGQVDHLILIRNGYQLVDEAYRHDYASLSLGRDQTSHQYNYTHPDWHPFHQGSELHTLQSVTKSVTALLVGIAIERGELPGVEPRVADLLPGDVQPRADERFQRMTVEDLLTMRAGIAWDEHSTPYDDPRNDCGAMEASEDWIAYVLARPMAAEPGEDWVYNSGATMLLSAIMTGATGVPIDQYAAEHLFQPLGITDYYWKITPTGLPDTEGGLYLKPADLARIGYLVLQGGVWGGRAGGARRLG